MPGGGMRIKSHAEHPSMLKGDYNVKNMLIQYESVENEAPPDTRRTRRGTRGGH